MEEKIRKRKQRNHIGGKEVADNGNPLSLCTTHGCRGKGSRPIRLRAEDKGRVQKGPEEETGSKGRATNTRTSPKWGGATQEVIEGETAPVLF